MNRPNEEGLRRKTQVGAGRVKTMAHRTKTRNNNFDFVRLLAACLVIWGHAYPILGVPGTPSIMGAPIHGFAVKIFFVVSGYLVIISWTQDPSACNFIAKRALRIFPALLVVVSISACVLGPVVTNYSLNDYYNDQLFAEYFRNFLLDIRFALPGVFSTNTYPTAVNGSLWTLPVEAAMYLLVLLSGLAFGCRSDKVFAAAWTILSAGFLALLVARSTVAPELFQGEVIYGTLVTAALVTSVKLV